MPASPRHVVRGAVLPYARSHARFAMLYAAARCRVAASAAVYVRATLMNMPRPRRLPFFIRHYVYR